MSECEQGWCRHTFEAIGVFPAGEIVLELATGRSWLVDHAGRRTAERVGLPGVDRIYSAELTFMGESGRFEQRPLPRRRPPLAGPHTTYWVASDESHRLELWVDPDQVRSAEDFATALVPNLQDPDSAAGQHQLAQVRALPGFPIQVRSGDGLVTVTVTRMVSVDIPVPTVPPDYAVVSAGEILGIPGLDRTGGPVAPPAPAPPRPPPPTRADTKADDAWHAALRRMAPKPNRDTWRVVASAPEGFNRGWRSPTRLFACDPTSCRSWSHDGDDPRSHPLACSSWHLTRSASGRYVTYPCGKEWIVWDTQADANRRVPRAGDEAAVGDDGVLTEVVEEQGRWVAVRGTRRVELGHAARPHSPGPGPVLAFTTGNGVEESAWFADGSRVDTSGLLFLLGERLLLSYGNGYSEVTPAGHRLLAGAPKAGWGGYGVWMGQGPAPDGGTLWWFETAVVLLDHELRPIRAHGIPEHADVYPGDQRTLFAWVGRERAWHRLAP